MDPLAVALAFGPVAVYCAIIGLINIRRFPLVMAGWKDTALLLSAFSGFAIIGPANLFFPLPAYLRFGVWVWVLLIVLYGLIIVSVILWMRPRIVVYNVPYTELRPVLSEVALALDLDARWAGDCLWLPTRGIQLLVEYFPLFRNARLIAVGRRQEFQAWADLEEELRRRLHAIDVGPHWAGGAFLAIGIFLALMAVLSLAAQPEQVAEAFDRLILR